MSMVVNPFWFGLTPVFRARFDAADGSVPVNEIGSVSSNGGSAMISSNRLVCNENWRTWAGGSQFDITDDWTLEIHYVSHNSDGNSGMIARSSSGTSRWMLYAQVDGSFEWYVADTLTIDVNTANILDGSHHIAVVKDSIAGRWTAYLDGVQIGSAVSTAKGTTSSNALYIGTDPFNTSTRAIKCNYDRVKITKACLYPYAAGNFTPPSASAE